MRTPSTHKTKKKEKYQQLITDPKLELKARQTQVITMINNVLNEGAAIELSLIVQPGFKFIHNQHKTTALINTVGSINKCDKPAPPMLEMVEATTTTIKVHLFNFSIFYFW